MSLLAAALAFGIVLASAAIALAQRSGGAGGQRQRCVLRHFERIERRRPDMTTPSTGGTGTTDMNSGTAIPPVAPRAQRHRIRTIATRSRTAAAADVQATEAAPKSSPGQGFQRARESRRFRDWQELPSICLIGCPAHKGPPRPFVARPRPSAVPTKRALRLDRFNQSRDRQPTQIEAAVIAVEAFIAK